MARSFLTDGVSPSAHALEGVALASGARSAPAPRRRTSGRSGRRPSAGWRWSAAAAPARPMHAGFVGAGGLDAAARRGLHLPPQPPGVRRQRAWPGPAASSTSSRTTPATGSTSPSPPSGCAPRPTRWPRSWSTTTWAPRPGGGPARHRSDGRRREDPGRRGRRGGSFDDLVVLGRRVAGARGTWPSPTARRASIRPRAGLRGRPGRPRVRRRHPRRDRGRGASSSQAWTPSSTGSSATCWPPCPPRTTATSCWSTGSAAPGNLEARASRRRAVRALAADGRRCAASSPAPTCRRSTCAASRSPSPRPRVLAGPLVGPHDTVALPTPRRSGACARGRRGHPRPGGAPSPWLAALAATFEARRPGLNALDQRAGDGDIGTNLENASR